MKEKFSSSKQRKSKNRIQKIVYDVLPNCRKVITVCLMLPPAGRRGFTYKYPLPAPGRKAFTYMNAIAPLRRKILQK